MHVICPQINYWSFYVNGYIWINGRIRGRHTSKILVAFYIQPPPTPESSSIQFINTKRLIFSSVFTEIHISLLICNHWAHLHMMPPIMMNSFLDFSHWSDRSQLNERHWCPSFLWRNMNVVCSRGYRWVTGSHFIVFQSSLFTPLHRCVYWRWLIQPY